MFLGHGLLAFALVALAGDAVGWSRKRALWLGVLAGAFATVPDVDMLYAPVGLLGGAVIVATWGTVHLSDVVGAVNERVEEWLATGSE